MKKAELFHLGCAGRDGFANTSNISSEELNVSESSAPFSLEPLQTIFDLARSTFPREDVLKKEENRN